MASQAELLERVSALLGRRDLTQVEFSNWLGGSADGGPNGDGYYPLTDSTGFTRFVQSPAAQVTALAQVNDALELRPRVDAPQNFTPAQQKQVLANIQAANARPVVFDIQTDMDILLNERATAKKLGIRTGSDQTDNLRAAIAKLHTGVIDFSEAGPIILSKEVRIETPIHMIGPGGYFENYGAFKRGTYFQLANNSTLDIGGCMIRVLYKGEQRDSRLAARISGFMFDGNKANNVRGDCLIFHGARYAQADDCLFINAASAGFRALTGGSQGATQSNTRLRNLVALYCRTNGFVLACPDTTAFGLIAGANEASGFNISAVAQLIGYLAWNNGGDGVYIAGDWMRVVGATYDNNRCGVYVNGDRVGVNLDGTHAWRNGLDLNLIGYTTDQKAGVAFIGRPQGCSARNLITGNNTDGADAGHSPQTYGLVVGMDGELPAGAIEAQVDYDMPSSVRDGRIRYIRVTATGSGYTWANVAITGAGSGATATAIITDGKVTGITITNSGSGYAGRIAAPASGTTGSLSELPGTPIVVTITGDGSGAAAHASHGGNVYGPVKDYSKRSGFRVSKLMVGDGTPIKKAYSAGYVRDLVALPAGGSDTFTYNSAALGLGVNATDFVLIVHIAGHAGATVSASLVGENTIVITRRNNSASVLPAGSYAIRVAALRFVE
ncbi:hypothetical protein [Sphingomonas dokdonensis]|uniref:Uncharacterized protein n=1 Tax=Sphingomonas dokdonensis TaxID=344880 RepID=A0A245ZD23_9SPHN|nr:hypothetical protein [Sphingomonas dokdonensis]OWK27587.1 hypothetical protein SPDO_32700 [Sphingomonas dokdonensis]